MADILLETDTGRVNGSHWQVVGGQGTEGLGRSGVALYRLVDRAVAVADAADAVYGSGNLTMLLFAPASQCESPCPHWQPRPQLGLHKG